MTSRPDSRRTGRTLLRLAVAGAVAAGAPLAVAGTANAASGDTWDKLAQCESGGNWSINTGNGYYGGLQFNPRTWKAFGGSGMPHQASRGEQIAVAERTLAAQGWNAWPACSRKLGIRGEAASPGKSVKASAPAEKAEKKVEKKAEPKKAEKKVEKKAEPKKAAQPQRATAPRAAAPVGDGEYTVVAGDTLSTLAQRHGIDGGWQRLWELNQDVVSNPNMIVVGQQLNLS